MKAVLFSAGLFLAFCNANGQTSITWGSPLTVASGTYSNLYPRVSLTSGNNPLVIWGKNSPNTVYTSRWSGSAFSMPVPVNPSAMSPFVAGWSGAELASSGDTAFVTFSAEPVGVNGHVYTVRSVNGGMSFEDTVRVSYLGTDIPRFPNVCINNGNPVVNFMRLDGSFGNAEYTVARSTDGGATYLADVNASLLVAGNVCDCCPGTVVTSGNREAVLYRNANSNIRTIHAEFSNDYGNSFTNAAEIDLTNWMFMACPSSGPSGVIVGDSLIYTWMSQASGTARVYIGTVNINDQQIGLNREISSGISGAHNYPVIAAKGDTVGVVWEGDVMGATDIYFSWSVNGAAGIGLNIDTLTTAISNDQTRPDLSFNNGKFHVVFSDNGTNQVKYLSGTINNIAGIDEALQPNGLKILYVHEYNGKIEFTAEAEIDMEVTAMLLTAGGQPLYNQTLHLFAGRHSYSLTSVKENGLYYLNLVSANEKATGKKIMITR